MGRTGEQVRTMRISARHATAGGSAVAGAVILALVLGTSGGVPSVAAGADGTDVLIVSGSEARDCRSSDVSGPITAQYAASENPLALRDITGYSVATLLRSGFAYEKKLELARKIKEAVGVSFDTDSYKNRPRPDNGYAGVVIEAFAPLNVYWKGEVPPRIKRLINEYRQWFRVNIRPAPHSHMELMKGWLRFKAPAGQRKLDTANIDLTTIGLDPGGRSLEIGYDAFDPRRPKPCQSTVERITSRVARVPVRVAYGEITPN